MELEVAAKQIEMDEETYGPSVGLAEVTIKAEGEIVLKDEVPWAMPVGEPFLLMQVYLLSQQPDCGYPEWQFAMEAFCYSFPDFRPPDKLWWSKNSFAGETFGF